MKNTITVGNIEIVLEHEGKEKHILVIITDDVGDRIKGFVNRKELSALGRVLEAFGNKVKHEAQSA